MFWDWQELPSTNTQTYTACRSFLPMCVHLQQNVWSHFGLSVPLFMCHQQHQIWPVCNSSRCAVANIRLCTAYCADTNRSTCSGKTDLAAVMQNMSLAWHQSMLITITTGACAALFMTQWLWWACVGIMPVLRRNLHAFSGYVFPFSIRFGLAGGWALSSLLINQLIH